MENRRDDGEKDDGRVIINFNYDRAGIKAVEALKANYAAKYPKKKCVIINGDEFLENKWQCDQLFNPDSKIQIYIHAHGEPGVDYISGVPRGTTKREDRNKIYIDVLADALGHFIGNHQKVMVNMLCCAGGRASNDDIIDVEGQSIAAKLHKKLSTIFNDRSIPVIARTHIVAVSLDIGVIGHKVTWNLSDTWEKGYEQNLNPQGEKKYVHHQPGGKVMFSHDEHGNQMIQDAYYHSWKTKVLSALTHLAEKTVVPDKKTFILEWIKSFETMNPEEIFNTIKHELNNPNTILNEHNYKILSLFKNASSFNEIKQLIEDREKTLSSENTFDDKIKLKSD